MTQQILHWFHFACRTDAAPLQRRSVGVHDAAGGPYAERKGQATIMEMASVVQRN